MSKHLRKVTVDTSKGAFMREPLTSINLSCKSIVTTDPYPPPSTSSSGQRRISNQNGKSAFFFSICVQRISYSTHHIGVAGERCCSSKRPALSKKQYPHQNTSEGCRRLCLWKDDEQPTCDMPNMPKFSGCAQQCCEMLYKNAHKEKKKEKKSRTAKRTNKQTPPI